MAYKECTFQAVTIFFTGMIHRYSYNDNNKLWQMNVNESYDFKVLVQGHNFYGKG